VNSLPVVYKYVQAAWVPAGYAVQIVILNNMTALAWAPPGFGGCLWLKALKRSASEYLDINSISKNCLRQLLRKYLTLLVNQSLMKSFPIPNQCLFRTMLQVIFRRKLYRLA